MLIIGGLVALGVLALIGAILLAIGEGRGTRAAAPSAPQTIPTTPEASASIPTPQAQQVETKSNTPEARDERTEQVLEPQAPAYSNGQFNELVIQLQQLHEQSKDLQARLGQLNEVVERMEQHESDMVELPRARRVS